MKNSIDSLGSTIKSKIPSARKTALAITAASTLLVGCGPSHFVRNDDGSYTDVYTGGTTTTPESYNKEGNLQPKEGESETEYLVRQNNGENDTVQDPRITQIEAENRFLAEQRAIQESRNQLIENIKVQADGILAQCKVNKQSRIDTDLIIEQKRCDATFLHSDRGVEDENFRQICHYNTLEARLKTMQGVDSACETEKQNFLEHSGVHTKRSFLQKLLN